MANLSKAQVIEKLTALRIPCDATASYADLKALLPNEPVDETQTAEPADKVKDEVKGDGKKVAKPAPLTEAELKRKADIEKRANIGNRQPAADEMMELSRLRARAKANDQK
jgi:hypothetical protein